MLFSIRPKMKKRMRTYKQLSQAQRHQIEMLNKAGKKPERDNSVAVRIASHDLPGIEAE